MLEFRPRGTATGYLAWGFEIVKGDEYLGRLLKENNRWGFEGEPESYLPSAKDLEEIARFMNGLELDAVRARRKNARRK